MLMLILFALTMVLNYTADKEKFLFKYRIDVGGLPINILDGLVALSVLAAIFQLSRPRYQGETTHRGFKWSVVLLVMACFTGTLGGILNSVEFREVAEMVRNVGILAVCIFIGYYTISTFKQAQWAAYIILFSSAASAFFVLLFLRESAETLSWSSKSFNNLRSVSRGGDLGLVCAGFVLFSVVSGYRFLPRGVRWTMFVVSLAGTFAMPHRSVWLTASVVILFAMLVLPKARMSRKLGSTILLGGLAGVILLSGAVMYARLTGRDFQEYIGVRFRSMVPGVEELKDNRPWDTRLPGIFAELNMWMHSPLIGNGFAYQVAETKRRGSEDEGFRHNVWTSSLAEAGLPLFLGYLLPCVLCVVVGKRLVNERMDRATVMIGAIAALHGFMAFLYASMTLSINQQRPAMPLGVILGLVLRTRDMQLAAKREYEGYLDFSAQDQEGHLPLFDNEANLGWN